jgi:hypothetical protein
VSQSEFGLRLRGLIKEKHKLASHVAKDAAQSPSVLSRLMSGEQKTISPTVYEAIVKAVTHDPREQADLLRAYLRDCCLGPGAELIDIRVKDAHNGKSKLPRSVEHSLTILRALCEDQTEVAALVVALADTLSRGKNGRRKKYLK